MNARRASTTEDARAYRKAGHDDALKFALSMGLNEDYRRDLQAKKDVIDPAGDAHSVKSGIKKWQMFLYGRNRFLDDDGFQALNGVGSLLVHCIDVFPPRYEDYIDNKEASKIRLQTPMRELKDRFQRKTLLRAFLRKSFFNGAEVQYLTVLRENFFYVYWCDDVVRALAEKFEVTNSSARKKGDYDAQKVLFRIDGKNVGELEMRNSSKNHYGEVLFNMNRQPCLGFFDQQKKFITSKWSDEIMLCGHAIKTFGKWSK